MGWRTSDQESKMNRRITKLTLSGAGSYLTVTRTTRAGTKPLVTVLHTNTATSQ